MEINQATPEQIASFKIGAAQRYHELGVAPDIADQLFAFEMSKAAGELGFVPSPSPKVQKIASDMAAALGRQRK